MFTQSERRRRLNPILSGLLALIALTSMAKAQSEAGAYPNKPVHILVGFSAGGGMDLLARVISQKLAETLGQPVIIDNKPGAGAMLAAELAARAPADGYTLLVAPNSTMVINPAVYTKLGYAPRTDFAPITMLASIPCILVVRSASNIKTVQDLIAYTKANPDKANSSGSSASFQLASELFKMRSGAPVTYIGYKGTNEAVTAVVSGEILMGLLDSPPLAPQLQAGTLRALAVASDKRNLQFPDVPTLDEAGVHGAEINLWGGLFAPAGTPTPLIEKLQSEVVRILKLTDVRARLAALNVDPVGDTSAEFSRFIASELGRWTAIARTANIKIEP